MGFNPIVVGRDLQVSTDRGPSTSIWKDCPVDDLNSDIRQGSFFKDDFLDFPGLIPVNVGDSPAGQWTAFLGNNAAVKIGTSADTTNLPVEGGVLGMTAGANNNLSISLAANMSAFRFISPASGTPLQQGKMWFEASIAVGSVASGAFDLFVGLMDTGDAGTRITSALDLIFSAADTLKTTTSMGACLGFWKRAVTNPTDVALVHNVNNGTVQSLGAVGNIKKLNLNYGSKSAMAAWTSTNGASTKPIGDTSGTGFLKLGWKYDPNAQTRPVVTALAGQTAMQLVKPLIRFYVNGFEIPIFYDFNIVQASTFPQTWMAPVIGFRSGATGIAAGIAYVDWVQCAQIGSF